MHLFKILSTLLFSVLACFAHPNIIHPRNGTRILPGEQFPFEYKSIADYGVSAYNFTVWLFTSPPSFFHAAEGFAAGEYMGRYSLRNHPGNDYPHNLPPPYLTMPNFEDLPVGFGVGESCENRKVYLVVIEEYATGEPSVGLRMSLSMNHVIYNATRP
ncbi:hypothetical protein EDD18DRAFT_487694 [Armillaria luteobubalina]|uniref:Uncharacterized protein n=1 Tax=Armillaria luteobubalina TaxID=153913 RepID=A0AA39UZ42_9AGAR|nr:hypothetical protein EDD18DRAFT_487694 [Armillaria luteobubalina]